MSRQTSPTIIGAFIVGAIALTIAGIIVFGSKQFMAERYSYVLYFDGSVKGLDIGAPVVFRGVKVGEVSNIQLIVDDVESNIKIPVTINIEPSTLTQMNGVVNKNIRQNISMMIRKGLKAVLQIQSLITGKLLIELEFYPEESISNDNINYIYGIPTKQSVMKKLSKKFQEIEIDEFPIAEVLEKGVNAITAIEKILTSPDLLEGITNINRTMQVVQKLSVNLDKQIGPLADKLQETMKSSQALILKAEGIVDSLQETMKGSQSLILRTEEVIGPLQLNINNTFSTVQATMKAAENTLQTIEKIASDKTALSYQIIDALEQLSFAANSLRGMTDYLQQHPESLFYGKGNN